MSSNIFNYFKEFDRGVGINKVLAKGWVVGGIVSLFSSFGDFWHWQRVVLVLARGGFGVGKG